MPAAIAIPLIAGAAGTVGAAAIGAHASGKAADQQVAASDKALGVQQQQYANGQRLLAPYQYGGPALAGLNQQVTNQGNGMQAAQMYAGNPRTLPQGGQPQTTVGSMNARAMALQGSQGALGAPQGGQMVTVQAPTGETRQMTQQQAQLAVQHGAQIVG